MFSYSQPLVWTRCTIFFVSGETRLTQPERRRIGDQVGGHRHLHSTPILHLSSLRTVAPDHCKPAPVNNIGTSGLSGSFLHDLVKVAAWPFSWPKVRKQRKRKLSAVPLYCVIVSPTTAPLRTTMCLAFFQVVASYICAFLCSLKFFEHIIFARFSSWSKYGHRSS